MSIGSSQWRKKAAALYRGVSAMQLINILPAKAAGSISGLKTMYPPEGEEGAASLEKRLT